MVSTSRGVPQERAECALLVRAESDRRKHLPLPATGDMESAAEEQSVR